MRAADALPAVAATAVGVGGAVGPGLVLGVTEFEAADSGERPAPLVAVTMKE